MKDQSVFEKSVIAILDPSKSTILGTGFVISQQYIVTCSHVIEDAGKKYGECVDFLLPKYKKIFQGLVTKFWSSSNEYDCCLLKIADDISKELSVLPLAYAQGSIGNSFVCLGYPDFSDYLGILANGIIEGNVLKENGQSMLQLSSAQLTRGHSGAPILDKTLRAVVGMVVEVYVPGRDTKNRDTCFALPTETIIDLCPDLGSDLIKQNIETETELHILKELSKLVDSELSLEDVANSIGITTSKSKLILDKLVMLNCITHRRQVLRQRIINFYSITAKGKDFLDLHNY